MARLLGVEQFIEALKSSRYLAWNPLFQMLINRQELLKTSRINKDNGKPQFRTVMVAPCLPR
jgi:hypothetical protein